MIDEAVVMTSGDDGNPTRRLTFQGIKPDEKLREHADAIRNLGKKSIECICEIGRHLSLAKKIAGHGRWLPWLQREFNWTERTATNFIRIYDLWAARKFENFSNLNLPVSSLYLIAQPSTPPEVRDEVLRDAEAGKSVSVAEVKDRIAKGTPSREQRAADRRSPEVTSEGLTGWWNAADQKGRTIFLDAVGVNNIWSAFRQQERDHIIAKSAPVKFDDAVTIEAGEIDTSIPAFPD